MEQLWNIVMPVWEPLLLLLVANGAPVIARQLLGGRYEAPLDAGVHFSDGRRLLGPSKSWRGLIAAIIATALCAVIIGLPWQLGVKFAVLSMLGDAVASFIKRRLAIPPHGRALMLDQLPEALLPLWLLRDVLVLDGASIVLAAVIFLLLDVLVSPLLYRWHLRQRPY